MSIYNWVREKAATSISSIELTDDFSWNKWLRASPTEFRAIEPLFSLSWDTDDIVLTIDIPASSGYASRFGKTKLFKSSSKMLILKSKTNPVFFGIGSSRVISVPFGFRNGHINYYYARLLFEGNDFNLKIKNNDGREITKTLSPSVRQINIPFGEINNLKNFDKFRFFPLQKLKNLEFEFSSSVKSIDFFLNSTTKRIEFASAPVEIKEIISDKIETPTYDINYSINAPAVVDYVSRMIPQIYNIDILNSLESLTSGGGEFLVKMDLLDKTPSIANEVYLQTIDSSAVKGYLPELKNKPAVSEKKDFALTGKDRPKTKNINLPDLKNGNGFLLSLEYYGSSSAPKSSGKAGSIGEDINKLLQPEITLSPEEEKELFKGLLAYQLEGAKFLADKPSAVLAGELVVDNIIQAAAALKLLFRTREIKSALVLTEDFNSGCRQLNSETGSRCGWDDRLNILDEGISRNIINSETSDPVVEIKKESQITVVTFEIFFEVLLDKIINAKKPLMFDCIIFDSPENFSLYRKDIGRFAAFQKPKYLWALTNNSGALIESKIFPDELANNILNRNMDSVRHELPSFVEEEFWIDLDKDQTKEYEQSLFYAQNQILDVFQTGNPYRLQAKVFMSLHQLKQLCNFYTEKQTSGKSELLLRHLKAVKSYGRKAVVFSQYDKAGTQKLIELFKKHEIGCVSFLPNMQPGERENALTKFSKDESVTVLLAGQQAAAQKARLPEADYIIHFDQWWVPVTKWHLNEKIISPESRGTGVISYFTKNTIDQKLKQILYQKGLLERHIVDCIGAETFSKLITEDEWMDIFNLPQMEGPALQNKEQPFQKLLALEQDKIIEKIRLLFINLGFGKVTLEKEDDPAVYFLKAVYKEFESQKEISGRIFLNKEIPISEVNKSALSLMKKNSDGRIFIVTLRSSVSAKNLSKRNIIVLDARLLGNYLQIFGIL